MVLVPFAVISDVILDAVLFSDGSIQEQLFSPTTQEVAIRLLFSTFILAAIYLGIHYLAKTSQKEAALLSRVQDLSLVRQDLEEFHENLSRQLRQTSASLTSTVELLQAQCSNDFDEKTRFFMENVYNCSSKLNEQLDINQVLKELTCCEPHREKPGWTSWPRKLSKSCSKNIRIENSSSRFNRGSATGAIRKC